MFSRRLLASSEWKSAAPFPSCRQISQPRFFVSQTSGTGGHCPFGIAFDVDGVLIRGREVIRAAPGAVRRVFPKARGGSSQQGYPCVFLTNGGGCTEVHKAKQLSEWMQVDVRPEQVILSHTPMKELVPVFQDQLVIVAGYGGVADVARSYGFKKVVTTNKFSLEFPDLVPSRLREPVRKDEEDHFSKECLKQVGAIMVFHDPNDWLLDLQVLTDVLAGHLHEPILDVGPMPMPAPTQPPLFFSNPDFLFSGAYKAPRFAQGAFRVALAALYKELTGQPLQYTLYGKPEPKTYRYAEKQLGLEAESLGYGTTEIQRFFGIGDNPYADIYGANLAKQSGKQWTSVLVETGSIGLSDDDFSPLLIPDIRLPHVGDAITAIFTECR
eukprot:gb/GEZN01007244.1/.p1 GENE.gb/GEZN01007244.1/~~gb/GEZN01007244.1/.p1  ORF type:complete len:383 (-),score=45.25 gb/GEZN01007244.1/:291-1439(-)